MPRRFELPEHDAVGITADNPGPFTLSGTNSWIVGHGPAWLIDPGPALPDHVSALSAELDRRGGLGGIALTHDHADHAEAVDELRRRYSGAPLAAGRGGVSQRLVDQGQFGLFVALYTPGHAPDHFALISGRAVFTGDAVLGEGSVIISPDPGALAGYLAGLERLKARGAEVLCPGHGPPVTDPAAKLDEYIAHRLDRERRLLAALDQGQRTTDELLDTVWDDVPPQLRPAAAVTLATHLNKLADEGRLPAGVERRATEL